MCGRYVITKPVTKTANIVKTNIKVEDSDNYNAHPTQKLPIIKPYTNGKALEIFEWGLIPEWSKKLKNFKPLINARLETLMEKITFKNLVQTSRCLVIADGYYEWKKEEKEKIPYYFTKEDNSLMTQDWVIEPKKKVHDIIKELNVPDLKIKDFYRIKIGE